MSVAPQYDEWTATLYDQELLGARCFYCGQVLAAPLVVWHGFALTAGEGTSLALHPPCMLELFLRLARDVWELECKSGLRLVLDGALGPPTPPPWPTARTEEP